MSAIKQLVDTGIQTSKVMVYSKTFCPYCVKAKKLLDGLGVSYNLVELDTRDDGAEIQSYLAQLTGQRTVPNIFISGKHVGGCDDLHAKHNSGDLKKLLAA